MHIHSPTNTKTKNKCNNKLLPCTNLWFHIVNNYANDHTFQFQRKKGGEEEEYL